MYTEKIKCINCKKSDYSFDLPEEFQVFLNLQEKKVHKNNVIKEASRFSEKIFNIALDANSDIELVNFIKYRNSNVEVKCNKCGNTWIESLDQCFNNYCYDIILHLQNEHLLKELSPIIGIDLYKVTRNFIFDDLSLYRILSPIYQEVKGNYNPTVYDRIEKIKKYYSLQIGDPILTFDIYSFLNTIGTAILANALWSIIKKKISEISTEIIATKNSQNIQENEFEPDYYDHKSAIELVKIIESMPKTKREMILKEIANQYAKNIEKEIIRNRKKEIRKDLKE